MSDYGYDLDERLDDYRDVNLLCWAFYPNQRAFSLSLSFASATAKLKRWITQSFKTTARLP